MKLMNIILLSLLLSLFVSCSKEAEKISGKITFSASSLVAGSIPVNGLVLNGTNGTNKIQLALSNANDDVIVELEPGLWSFKVIAWNNNGNISPLHGYTTCGISSANLDYGDFTISIDLNKTNCGAATFGPSSMKRSDDPTTFKEFVLRPCLYFNGLSFTNPLTETCYDSWKQAGFGKSFRVVFYNVNTVTGLRSPGITSKCVNIDAGSDGQTSMALPLNAPNGSFPFVINTYEKKNCSDDVDQSYFVSTGAGISQVTKVDFNINDTHDSLKSYFYFADNFVGHGYSALVDIQPEDPTKCGGSTHCLDNETGLANIDHNRFETIKDQAFTVLGSPSGSRDNISTHSAVKVDDGGGNAIIVYKIAQGSSGGGGNLTLSVGALTLNEDSTTNLDIQSNLDIATLVGNINTSANYRAIVVEGSNEAATIPAGVYTFSPGQDSSTGNNGRDDSILKNIAQIYGGAVGAVLYHNGLTTCTSVLSAIGNTYTINDPLEGGSIDINIAAATQNVPIQFSAGGGSAYEGRIEINESSSGETETQFLEFNCTTTGEINKMGFFARSDSRDGRINKEEVYYESGSTWTNTKVEVHSYHSENGKVHRNVISMKGFAVDSFHLWAANYYDDGTSTPRYERVFIDRTAGGNVEIKAAGLVDLDSSGVVDFSQASGLFEVTPVSGTEELFFTERKFTISPLSEVTAFSKTAVEYPYASGFNPNVSSGDETLSYDFVTNIETKFSVLP